MARARRSAARRFQVFSKLTTFTAKASMFSITPKTFAAIVISSTRWKCFAFKVFIMLLL